jgi:hypothetical protein
MIRAVQAAAIVCSAFCSISVLTPAAQADAPEQRVETFPYTLPVWTDCEQYGGDAIISATGIITRRVQVRTDASGSVREVRHVHFTGTLTGPSGTATYMREASGRYSKIRSAYSFAVASRSSSSLGVMLRW